jgi:hypothetical protein
VIAQAAHDLRLSYHPNTGGFVQSFRFDQREGNVAIQDRVVRQEDLLLPALTKEFFDGVAAVREGDWVANCGSRLTRCPEFRSSSPTVGALSGALRYDSL